jgi:hypothetical protein
VALSRWDEIVIGHEGVEFVLKLSNSVPDDEVEIEAFQLTFEEVDPS